MSYPGFAKNGDFPEILSNANALPQVAENIWLAPIFIASPFAGSKSSGNSSNTT
jgi:hypothetical protein